jgi:hypothetical protein
MLMNGAFFSDFIRSNLLPETRIFREAFNERVLPAFGNIEEEAKEFEQTEYDRLCRTLAASTDPGTAAEMATDNAVEYYMNWER